MRIYHSTRDNREYETISPRQFPHIFAVCRAIHPVPQFQLIAIERMRGHDEYAHYIFENEPIENVETMIVHEGNPEERTYGQMFIVIRDRNDPNRIREPRRVRFEMRNVYLVTRNDRFPVVAIEDMEVLPPLDAAIIPRNCMPNHLYNNHEPYFMMNYLIDNHNFRPPNFDVPFYEPGLMNLQRLHRERDRRRREWYDMDDYPMRAISPLRDVDREDYINRQIRNNIYPPRMQPAAAGAGRGTRRRDRPQTPPRDVPQAPPVANAAVAPGPLTLQAFTIQAIINHAVSENMACPISMNPIAKDTAAVTTCQHVFERDSIAQWMADHENCPVCRQRTSICN
jgi:hypothetical protein